MIFTDLYRNFRTFLGDFTPDRLDSRSLQTLWEWKNRVLLEEYYIFDVANPLEVKVTTFCYCLLLVCCIFAEFVNA